MIKAKLNIYRLVNFCFFSAAVLMTSAIPLFSEEAGLQKGCKTLIIQGNQIYSTEKLQEIAAENCANEKNDSFLEVNGKLKKFYRQAGYELVRIYLIDETRDSLSIYIDEGKIGQLRIAGFDELHTAAVKVLFRLPYKVYNSRLISENLKKIKRQLKIDAEAVLIEEENYDSAFFQLDKEFKIPVVGEKKLPFFEKYGYRYNLEIKRKTSSSGFPDSSGKTGIQFNYGLNSDVVSKQSPWLSFTFPHILNDEDLLKIRLTSGWNYGLLKPDEIPSWSENTVEGQYYPPGKRLFRNFTPRTVFRVIQSTSGRDDLGIENYDFVLLRTVLEPGYSFMPELRLYTGLGLEKDFVSNVSADEDVFSRNKFNEDSELWLLFTTSIELSEIFWYFEKNDFIMKIDTEFYFNSRNFHEASFQLGRKHYWGKTVSYSTGMQIRYSGGGVPFYHDKAVKDYYFRGDSFSAYHSFLIASLRNDLGFSLYRDYFTIGWFLDLTAFENYGHDIKNFSSGIVSGPKTDFLAFDQLECSVLAGYDFLFISGRPQFMISFSCANKW